MFAGMARYSLTGALVGALVVLSACGGASAASPAAPTATVTVTVTPETAPTATPTRSSDAWYWAIKRALSPAPTADELAADVCGFWEAKYDELNPALRTDAHSLRSIYDTTVLLVAGKMRRDATQDPESVAQMIIEGGCPENADTFLLAGGLVRVQ